MCLPLEGYSSAMDASVHRLDKTEEICESMFYS